MHHYRRGLRRRTQLRWPHCRGVSVRRVLVVGGDPRGSLDRFLCGRRCGRGSRRRGRDRRGSDRLSRVGLCCGRRRLRGGLRRWGGRHRGCRGRAGDTPRREQAEWVDVRVAVGDPDAKVDVGRLVLSVTGRPGLGDRISLADRVALSDAQVSEMRERGFVAVGGLDRDREAVSGDLAREGHLARGRRPNGRRRADRDVEAAVLAGRVLVTAHGELSEHRAVCRPGPCPRRMRAQSERSRQPGRDADCPSRCPESEHGATVARSRRGGNAIDRLVTESVGRACSSTLRSVSRRLPRLCDARRLRRPDPTPRPAQCRPHPTRATLRSAPERA